MKKFMTTNKLLFGLLAMALFASCAKEELETEAVEPAAQEELKSVKSWTLGGDYTYGDTIFLWADSGVPNDWVIFDRYRRNDNGFPRWRHRLVYLKGAPNGFRYKVLANQSLPDGWSYEDPNDTSGTAWIIYIDPAAVTPPSLLSGQTLWSGQTISSPSGQYKFAMQTDGNIVLYDSWNLTSQGWWTALWHSHTYNNPGARLIMQTDGNMVLYSTSNQPLWYSHTWAHPGAQLHVQDDSNLAIYSNGVIRWQR